MPFLHRFYADLGSIEAPGSRQSISKLVFLEVTTITMRLWIDIHQEEKNNENRYFPPLLDFDPNRFCYDSMSHWWLFQQLEHLYGFFQGQDLDGKLRRAASADELAERLKEARCGRPMGIFFFDGKSTDGFLKFFFLVGQFDHLGVWFLWTGVIWSYICSPKADQCQLERIVVGSVVLILILSFWNGPLFRGRVDQMIWECSCRWNEPRCSALMSALQLRSIHEKADGAW